MSIFSSRLTYGDFRRTGEQDCGNVLQYDDFDLKAGTPEQIVEKAWAEWEEDGMEEQWLSQQDPDEWDELDPHKCYEAWKSGWKGCAEYAIKSKLEDTEVYGDDELNDNPPPKWWRKPAPTRDRPCYRTKIEALRKFLEVNYRIVENYGGADYKVSPSEFDSINHKYDLTGKKAVRTIADAVWVAMPVGKPYCLDRIDLDALNDTSPAREAGVPFVLPDVVYATQMAEEEARHYAAQEPERIFPPVPQIPEGPMRLHLEHRHGGERGVERYQMLPPLPPQPEVRPMRVELESQEPGVSTFRFNPASIAVGNVYDVTTASGPDQFQIIGYFDKDGVRKWRVMWADGHLSAIDERSLSSYEATFSHRDHVAQPKIGNPASTVKIKMTSTRSGNVGWIRSDGTPSNYESEAGHFTPEQAQATIDEYTENLVRVVGRCANRFDMVPVKGNPAMKNNPAWVTNILSKYFVKLEEQIPPKWLPKLTSTSTQRGKLVAAMKEYGCGAYGCVLPTLDPNVVLKLTTDDTEAQFAHDLADKLAAPVVVKYHLTFALPDVYKGRQVYLLWRDSAEHVDKVEQTIAEEGGADPVLVEAAIATQHAAAQEAFEALDAGQPAEKLLKKWEKATREMGESVPELRELAEGMITNLHTNKVFFGDVHGGNIGLVNGKWVVVDPGHVAVLEA